MTCAAFSTAPLIFASGKQMEGSALKDNIFFSSKLATTAASKFTKAALFSHKLLVLVIFKTCLAIADSEDSYKKFSTTFITFLKKWHKT